MIRIGITAIVNFSDWNDPNYPETGGINSVIKNILPHIQTDKIILYGITYDRKNLLKEKIINSQISVFPIVYASSNSIIPKRVWTLLFGWRLKKYLKNHNIDVVYSHAEEMAFWIAGTSIPYIHHLHTFVNVLDVSGKKLAKLSFLKIVWERLRRFTIRKSAKIIAVNSDIVALGEAIIGSDRIIRFPNYVDMRAFIHKDGSQLKKRLIAKDKKVALFIGRISYVKGLNLFVDSILALNSENKEWVGVIVGNGDYQGTLKEYITRKAATDQFIFVGSVNTIAELSDYYSLADVFLITSISESVPLTLLESLSCGTPVVSTDVGIAKKILGQKNGFVIESREPQEFKEKILMAQLYKTHSNLIVNPYEYSVDYASALLNKEFRNYDK
jgi:glycosyltransferase involved in cell wall biosynthesis